MGNHADLDRNPRIPEGYRVYAIGDMHGRLDLLELMIDSIRDDDSRRDDATRLLVILGDFIDRGPASMEIISLLRTWQALEPQHVIILKGNHEEALVNAWRGDTDFLSLWLKYGGAETLRSFGGSEPEQNADPAEIHRALRATIPKDVIEWLSTLPTKFSIGDYMFVHAGIRPGQPLDRQNDHDLLWIRDTFLKSKRNHGMVIVHGHSVTSTEPELLPNRIGIDTGASASGRLTAVGLAASDQWVITAAERTSLRFGRDLEANGEIEGPTLNASAEAHDGHEIA